MMTPEQQAVVDSKEKRLVVSASAGSGKTRVLVERYLRHVEDGYSPDSILATTFTRKAAAEMRERIVKMLIERGRVAEAVVAETGPIQTLHSFYERILRENAIAAGIDPAFEFAGGDVVREIASQAISRVLQQDLFPDPYIELLIERSLNAKFYRSDFEGFLLEGLLGSVRGFGSTPEQLLKEYVTPEVVLERWFTQIADSKGIPLTDNWSEWLESLPKKAFPNKNLNNELYHAENTCGFVHAICQAWEMLDDELKVRQKFDQVLMEEMAVNLLKNNEAVRERVNKTYPIVLIDEAQDLNPTQHAFISQLDPEQMLIVGDPQQSIYRFRQAEVRLFENLLNTLPSCPLTRNHRVKEQGILNMVDELFSKVWEAYKPMADPNAEWRGFEGVEFWEYEKADRYLSATRIKDMVGDRGLEEDFAILVSTSESGGLLYDALRVHEVPAKLMAGGQKFFARLEVRDIANLLFSLSNPRDDFALLAVLRGPAVMLSFDGWVRLAQHKQVYDHLEVEELPEGDVEAVKRFKAWFDPLSKKVHRLSVNEALAELLRESPYLENIIRSPEGDRMMMNVRKLQTIAAESPDLSAKDFAERIRLIQRIRHRAEDSSLDDPSEPGVKIMTLHSSKGLEFDTVVVHTTLDNHSERIRELRTDPLTNFIACVFKFDRSVIDMYSKQLIEEQSTQESWRKIYVAMTRAKRKLVVIVPTKPGRRRLSGEYIHQYLNLTERAQNGSAVVVPVPDESN